MNKTYLVKTDNYTFELDITKYNNDYHFEYGNPNNRRGPCILMTYRKNSKTIKLNHIDYYKSCGKDKDLLRGTGTQEMLQTALRLVIQFFPEINKVILNDVSNFKCENTNTSKNTKSKLGNNTDGDDGASVTERSAEVLLSIYYLLLYGETWYENKFKAKYSDKNQRADLNKFKKLLKEKPRMNIFSFYNPNLGEFNTWHEYFTYIKENDGCVFFTDNKHKKEIENVANIKFVYSEWYIRKKDIDLYEYNIKDLKEVKTGGGFTPIFNKYRV